MNRIGWRKALWTIGIGVAFSAGSAFGEVPEEWRTPAERAGFEATPGYRETTDFLGRLAAASPHIRVDSFGTSPEGRWMPLVIVSKRGAFTAEAAKESGRAVVLIQNGIHAGEIDGKDACLMLLRDFVLGKHPDWLERLILVIVPIYNVDGHERISPFNRPNQLGPVQGMGFRTTADGHDLNRDHMKLSTPEARAMIKVYRDWQPHLHVDNHVTDGADHDWVLTYSWAEAPQAPAAVDRWLDQHMDHVVAATRTAGHRVGPYVSLIDRNDPSLGFDSYVGGPRFATGYYPLRNRPSILVEDHAYKPYGDRVRANRDFLVALLDEVAGSHRELIDAVVESENATVAAGRPDAPPSEVVVRYRQLDATETIEFPTYDWYVEPSIAMGTPLARYHRGKLRQLEVPWKRRVEPELTLRRPRGYFVLPGWTAIERRLADHGLSVRRLPAAQTFEVETIRISNPRQDSRSNPSYQGLTQIEVDVTRTTERRRLPKGALWIPADQPDFEVAVQLLEPEAPDSLVRWGLLSSVLERKEYIEPRVLEALIPAMLEDPQTARDWKTALEDEEFAAQPWARYMWWYQRTPYWDATVGLMPVMRLMSPPLPETGRWVGPRDR